MNHPIISVHTPKTAGTSFLEQLKTVYGGHSILHDNSDDPVDVGCRNNIDPEHYKRNPIVSINPYRIVHGHFHASKYAYLEGARLITFLRHPIDNLISIYRFWGSHAEPELDGPVFKYFKKNSLSIENLAMLPKIRYLYSESYFGGIDMGRFEFIGDFGQYDQELKRLGKILDVNFSPDIKVNVTNDREPGSKFETGKTLRAHLEKILEQDIRFFERYAGH